ncbi:MAG: MBL fold metallo-hydrolase [Patescibacteria group bacterium]|jgi:L-ascorbate metabolism protein UlaG (beta-lactamase superfamily)
MKIKWLGQSAFEIKSNKTLITDPHNPMVGKMPKDLAAEVVTVSHAHMDHNYTKAVAGSPEIIDKTGDFSAGGFEIKGVSTFHDNVDGKKRGNNVVYVFDVEGLRLCHLGDLGHLLTDEQLKEIGAVDILMIPVGGFFTIGPDEAVKVTNQLKPKIVLPMHYKAKSLMPFPLAGVDKFTAALGWDIEEVEELEITKSTLNSFNHKAVIFKK